MTYYYVKHKYDVCSRRGTKSQLVRTVPCCIREHTQTHTDRHHIHRQTHTYTDTQTDKSHITHRTKGTQTNTHIQNTHPTQAQTHTPCTNELYHIYREQHRCPSSWGVEAVGKSQPVKKTQPTRMCRIKTPTDSNTESSKKHPTITPLAAAAAHRHLSPPPPTTPKPPPSEHQITTTLTCACSATWPRHWHPRLRHRPQQRRHW